LFNVLCRGGNAGGNKEIKIPIARIEWLIDFPSVASCISI